MHNSSFPGLRDEGMTFTCERAIALANEDRQFISWEHPLVTGAMDMVLGNELGNCAMTAIKYGAAKPGTLLLECLYTLDTVSSDVLQTSRYLPPTTIRVVIDQHDNDHSETLTHEIIKSSRETIPADTAIKIVRTYTQLLRDMISASETLANRQAPELLAAAHEKSKQTLVREIERLKALSKVNPNVRPEEIEFMELQREALATALDAAALRLDALRVVVAT